MTFDINKLNSTQKKLVLFLVGALANLAFAPFEAFPVLLLSFPVFFVALQAVSNAKQAFWFGWWFGFGHFLAGLYWISNSLLVDAEQFAWLIPFAMAGIPAILAIYIGFFAGMFATLNKKFPPNITIKTLLFCQLWLLIEIFRSYLFTGFPWNLLGYSLLANAQIAQVASLGGVFLCSWLACFWALFPIYFRSKKLAVVAFSLVLASYGFGYSHIHRSELLDAQKTVKIVQPNIKQSMKLDAYSAQTNFLKTLALSDSGVKADVIIWPEASTFFQIDKTWPALNAIQGILGDGKIAIIGSTRSEGRTPDDYKVWNSMFVISRNKIENKFDKQHLVPFGEYVPFSNILPIEKITAGKIDISSGNSKRELSFGGATFLPLVCYEAIFTNYAFARNKSSHPIAIVNATNDAWFGDSTGPYQHLAMARLRAIEQGVPVLRAANTGISAIIDSFGAIQVQLPLNQTATIDAKIPAQLTNPTIYAQLGWQIVLLFFVLLGAASLIVMKKHKKHSC